MENNMDLSQIVKLECCETDFKAKNKDEALLKMSDLLKKNDQLKGIAQETIFKGLKDRENMGSTGFGRGIAIPHTRIEGLQEFVIGIAISTKGVFFDALDKKKVKIFVVIVGPPEDRSGHLKLLAKVSLILKENTVIDNLLKAKTKISLYEEFIRNIQNGSTDVLKKGNDKLMILIVKDDSIMEDITEVFIEFGIEESTIIETQQMENLLSKVPLFMGFFNFTGEKNPYSKIVLLKINQGYVNAVIKNLEDIFGDLDSFSGLSLMVLDLFNSKG
jgi:mannitol/fructose-specific phosphotransferase system IIA component (Ntr-type)